MKRTPLTHARLLEVIKYDPESGVFTWRKSLGKARPGATAGTLKDRWRRIIIIDGDRWTGHRLAWFYMLNEVPDNDVRSINGDGLDLRWINLTRAPRPIRQRPVLSAHRLRSILHFDPSTGIFTWLNYRGGTARAGSVAGHVNAHGYVKITVDGKEKSAHRLAFLYMNGSEPPYDVDHINGVRHDNRWVNLRAATESENSQNQKRAKVNNSTGFLGVAPEARTGGRIVYRAQIRVDGTDTKLGYYDTPEDAHSAYLRAKRVLHPYGTI